MRRQDRTSPRQSRGAPRGRGVWPGPAPASPRSPPRPRPRVASEPAQAPPTRCLGPRPRSRHFSLATDRRERVTSRRPPSGSACGAKSAAGWVSGWGARGGKRAVGASRAGPVPGTCGPGGYARPPWRRTRRSCQASLGPSLPRGRTLRVSLSPSDWRPVWGRGLGVRPRGISEWRREGRRPAVGWVAFLVGAPGHLLSPQRSASRPCPHRRCADGERGGGRGRQGRQERGEGGRPGTHLLHEARDVPGQNVRRGGGEAGRHRTPSVPASLPRCAPRPAPRSLGPGGPLGAWSPLRRPWDLPPTGAFSFPPAQETTVSRSEIKWQVPLRSRHFHIPSLRAHLCGRC